MIGAGWWPPGPRRRPVALIVVSLALSACVVAPSPAPSAGPVTPSRAPTTRAATAPPTPEPSTTIDPAVLLTTNVTCGDGVEFAAVRLAAPVGADFGSDAAAGRLRAFLAGPDRVAANLPATGWIRIDIRPNNVLFIARSPDGWLQVGFELDPGGWTLDRYGSCGLRPVLPDGVGPARWWLDPAAPAPAPGATEIAALVVEMACASGRSPEGRVAAPVIIEQPDRIIAMIADRGQPGDQDCQGNPPLALRFSLPSPLGTRRLFDGGAVPPRDATIPWP